MAAHSQPLAPKKRLDSWKEIAAFFGRDERTVKRWEKERGLPVYRVPGSARGGVFAYAEELSEWLKAPNHVLDFAAVAAENPAADEDINRTTAIDLPEEKIAPEDKVPAVVPSAVPALDLHSAPAQSKLAATKPFLWLVPLALIAGFFLVFSFGHHTPKFKNALAAPHVPSADAQDLYLTRAGTILKNARLPI